MMNHQVKHSTKKKKKKTRSGITLVESVVAVCLFGLFIAGACQLVVSAKQTADRARKRYAAVNMARNRIERLNTYPFDEMDMAIEHKLVVGDQGIFDPQGDFQVTTEVSPVTDKLKLITVTVAIRHGVTRKFDKEKQVVVTYRTDLSERVRDHY